jgi:hypothetical protein
MTAIRFISIAMILGVGELQVESCIRVDRIFTIEKSLVVYKVGSLLPAKMNIVLKQINSMFNS